MCGFNGDNGWKDLGVLVIIVCVFLIQTDAKNGVEKAFKVVSTSFFISLRNHFFNLLISLCVFFFSKFLLFLIQPLNWILGLTVYGLIGKNPKSKRRALRIAIGILFIISNPLISNLVAEIYEAKGVEVSTLTTYDAAIILGGFSNLKTPYNADRLNLGIAPNRFSQTIDLYHQGKIKKIVLSGGNGNVLGHQQNEAIIAAAYLNRVGIPQSDIIIDKKSRNTYENFKFSKELLKTGNDFDKILVVTSAFHVPRSRLIAKRVGLSCDFFPTDFFFKNWMLTPHRTFIPNTDCISMWEAIIKEWFGMLAYKLKGYI